MSSWPFSRSFFFAKFAQWCNFHKSMRSEDIWFVRFKTWFAELKDSATPAVHLLKAEVLNGMLLFCCSTFVFFFYHNNFCDVLQLHLLLIWCKLIRGGWRYQNRYIFGKIPNSPPHFRKIMLQFLSEKALYV